MFYILITWLLAPVWWPISIFRSWITPTPKKILVVEIAGIGDVVCSTSVFLGLRTRYPSATIDLIVDPIAQGLAPLLTGVNATKIFSYREQKGFQGRLRLALICSQYDTLICLVPSSAQLEGFCLSAAPRRLSILPPKMTTSYGLLRPLLTESFRHGEGTSFISSQLKLCKFPASTIAKHIQVTDSEREISELPSGVMWVGLLISSGRALKRLSDQQIARIISDIDVQASKTNIPVGCILIGGATDRGQAIRVEHVLDGLQSMPLVLNMVGKYELSELTGLLSQLKAFVGVDSGVTHLANALGIPVVCIAGPVNLAEVYQESNSCKFLTSDLTCYPCSTVFNTPSKCMLSRRACLDDLDTERVADSVFSFLEKAHD